MVRPHKYWLLGLLDVPQVDVLALARHRQLLLVLPLDLTTLKSRVKFSVVKSDNHLASLRVPDRDYRRHAARGYLLAIVLVELGHHEHGLEVLESLDSRALLSFVLLIHLPHTGVAV